MDIETLHKLGACSTLLITGLMYNSRTNTNPNNYMEKSKSLEDFTTEMKWCLDNCKPVDHVDKKHDCREYAFLLASTDSQYPKPQEWLRQLGFKETPEAFNAKNGTVAQLFWITVEEITETLGCNKKYIRKFTGAPT